MSKIALINDIHFGIKGDSAHMLDYQEKFFKYEFIPTLINNNIKTILLGGDVFDRRKYINFLTLKRTREMFFDIIRDMGIDVHIIPGNHDCHYKNSNTVNSIELLLSDYSNLRYYTEPTTLKFDGDVEIDMIPWINQENYDDTMKFISSSNSNILYGHLELQGFEMYAGTECDHGMSASIFKRYEQVWSGHFHHRSNKGNINYLGAPMEFTFADSEDPRGFHIFDTLDKSLTFIKNKYTMFVKILYNDSIESNRELYLNSDFSEFEYKHIKLFVIKNTKPALFESFIEKLFELRDIILIIHQDYSEFGSSEVDIEEIKTTTTKELIDMYVDKIETDKDKNKLKRILNSIYIEALHQGSPDSV